MHIRAFLRDGASTHNAMLEKAATRENGFALLLVIWVLALLAVIAAGVAADSQSASTIARNRIELARARALAEAGVTLAIAGLTVPDVNARWRADGFTRPVRYDNSDIDVTVQDEGGKIDLNRAPMELIAGLLDALNAGTTEERAAVIAGIADQRKAASARAPVVNAGVGVLPRRRRDLTFADGPFANVSELRQLPGVTHALYDRVRPFVTVYTRRATINPLTAPREVLAALPGVNQQAIDLFIAARQVPASATPSAGLQGLGIAAASYLAVADTSPVTIIARAETQTGISFAQEATVALDAIAGGAFKYLEWHQSIEPEELAQQQAGR